MPLSVCRATTLSTKHTTHTTHLMDPVEIQHKLNQLLDARSNLHSVMDAEDKDTFPIILHLDELIDEIKQDLKDSLTAV